MWTFSSLRLTLHKHLVVTVGNLIGLQMEFIPVIFGVASTVSFQTSVSGRHHLLFVCLELVFADFDASILFIIVECGHLRRCDKHCTSITFEARNCQIQRV